MSSPVPVTMMMATQSDLRARKNIAAPSASIADEMEREGNVDEEPEFKSAIGIGELMIVVSAVLLFGGTYFIMLSSWAPRTGVYWLDAVLADNHYKYLSVLVIPVGVYFVIANWVGWQYFRNA